MQLEILTQTILFLILAIVPSSFAARRKVGFGFSFGETHSAINNVFPETPSEAEAAGWNVTNATNVDSAVEYVWQLGDVPLFKLYYDNSTLVGLYVIGPTAYNPNDSNKPFIPPAALLVDGQEELMEYRMQFGPNEEISVGGIDVPLTVQGAEALGWVEGGCVESMGGSHFVIPNRSAAFLFSPIYDKYGTGKLNTISIDTSEHNVLVFSCKAAYGAFSL